MILQYIVRQLVDFVNMYEFEDLEGIVPALLISLYLSRIEMYFKGTERNLFVVKPEHQISPSKVNTNPGEKSVRKGGDENLRTRKVAKNAQVFARSPSNRSRVITETYANI